MIKATRKRRVPKFLILRTARHLKDFFSFNFQGVACLLALAVLSSAEEEKKEAAVEEKKEDTKAVEPQADKKQDKRGIHEYGDWSSGGGGHHHGGGGGGGGGHGHHTEKTLTIVKKIPVPVAVHKTVHVPHIKEVHVPVHVKVNKPYPVVKHVRWVERFKFEQ